MLKLLIMQRRMRALWIVLLSVWALLPAEHAWAQTVQLSPATFKIERPVPRQSGESPLVLNYDDCVSGLADETIIRITPVLRDFPRQRSLEVWVGSGRDCSKDDERGTTGFCRRLDSQPVVTTGQLILIAPQDVVEAIRNPSERVEAKGRGTIESCDARVFADVTFYVMIIDNNNVLGTPGKWDNTSIDARPPGVPPDLAVTPGDSALFASWTSQEDSDLAGYTVFCEEVDCSGGGIDDSIGVAGSTGLIDPTCTGAPSVIVPGARLTPEQAERYTCGRSSGLGAKSATLKDIAGVPLENGACYAIAVSATDRVKNKSPLSGVTCGSPQDVTTFFEAYRDAGGKGGGGFCGVAELGRGRSMTLACLVTVIFGLAFTVRRARRGAPTE